MVKKRVQVAISTILGVMVLGMGMCVGCGKEETGIKFEGSEVVYGNEEVKGMWVSSEDGATYEFDGESNVHIHVDEQCAEGEYEVLVANDNKQLISMVFGDAALFAYSLEIDGDTMKWTDGENNTFLFERVEE